jgi:hypothetical protein
MTDPTIQAVINQTVALIRYYGFETGDSTAIELVANWLEVYQPIWVRLAVVEALYQGRYKAVSIEQILAFWVRRGHPVYHFNHEFESLVCREIPLFPTRPEEWEKLYRAIAASPVPAELPASLEFLEDFRPAAISAADDEYCVAIAEPPIDDSADLGLPAQEETAAIANPEEPLPKPVHRRPIHKFTPPEDASDFYKKLKRVTETDR